MPVPLITLFTVIAASVRLKLSVPLFTMLLAVAMLPVPGVTPLSPICSVPALIVVCPAYVLLLVSTVVPAPVWVSLPVAPAITPESTLVEPAPARPTTVPVPVMLTPLEKMPSPGFATLSARLMASVEVPFTITGPAACDAAMLVPSVVPSPICSVPVFTVVWPV